MISNPLMLCSLCPSNTKILCICCNIPFCNVISGTSSSHILLHLISHKHKEIRVNNIDVLCFKCKNRNIFALTMDKKNRKDKNIYLCTSCTTGKNISFIVSDRRLQLYNTISIRLRYNYKSYYSIYTELINMEMAAEEKKKEELKISSPNFIFSAKDKSIAMLKLDIDRYKVNIGDEIEVYSTIHGKISLSKGIIAGINVIEEEVKIKLDDYKKVMDNKNLLLEFNFKNICYERMKRAVKHINLYVNKDMLDIIFNGIKYNDTEYKDSYTVIYEDKIDNMVGAPGCSKNNKNRNNIIYLKNTKYKLNKSQIEAISLVLRNKLSIIQGPPGSGKTLTCANIIYNLYKHKNSRDKILIVSPSNVAVDNIVRELLTLELKVLRIYSKNREHIENENDSISLHKKIKNNSYNYRIIRNMIVDKYDIICCTCATAGSIYLKEYSFAYVLIDEAVQAVEPLSIIPLNYNCKKLILVGDHRQLGPTIISHEAKRRGYNISLFERMINIGVQPHILNLQYRMDPEISEFISTRFYNGCLVSDKNYKNTIKEKIYKYGGEYSNGILDLLPTFFYHTPGIEHRIDTSFYNINEVENICSLILWLLSNGIEENDIGIITMYDGQRSKISKILKKHNIYVDLYNIDGFQGREKNIIIISLVRVNEDIGFIANNRRMNVAMSRGKHALILVGNVESLIHNKQWKETLTYYQNKNSIVEGNINNMKKYKIKELEKEIKFDLKDLLKDLEE